jgi:hypothetical protein
LHKQKRKGIGKHCAIRRYEDSADKAVTAGVEKPHMINGCKVSVKLAERREEAQKYKKAKTTATGDGVEKAED